MPELVIVFAGCAVISALLSIRLLAAPGWVGMHHDWAPTPFPGQIQAWASDEFYGWLQFGTGIPSNYPNDWLILALYSVIGSILDASLISKFTLVAVPAVAAFGTYLLARKDLKLSIVPSCTAAFFAATNPVIFNKIIAGQLAYLWGYALFPLWLTAYRITCTRTANMVGLRILSGIISAIISSQIQFVVFMLAAMIIDAIATRRRVLDAVISPLASIGCIVVAQSATFFSVSQSIGYLSHSVVNVPAMDWIRVNSATILEALALRGYVTHYFTNMYGLLPVIGGFCVPLGIAFTLLLSYGAIVAWRDQRARMFPILWLFGVYTMAGVNAPGSGFIVALYSHVREMQMFREVYHWAVLAAVSGAILFAYAVASLGTIKRIKAVAAVIVFGDLLLYFAPALTGNWSGQIQVVQTSPLLRTYYERLSPRDGNSRVLWLPVDQPMSVDDTKLAGLDPMGITRPASLWEYVLTPPVSVVALGIRTGDATGLDRLLEYSAVKTIVLRKGFVSRVPDFSYRKSPQFGFTYSPYANERGLRKLGWKITHNDAAIVAYDSPSQNEIIATASGFALVPPIARLLPLVRLSESPLGPAIPDTISQAVIEEPDIDTMIALASVHRTNLLDAGIILDSADATVSWAPINAWWYYRYSLTQALDASMISTGQTLLPGRELVIGPVARGARVILSFVASPYGGPLQVQTPDGRYLRYNTLSSYPRLWSTSVIAKKSGQFTIRNLGGEQAIRRAFALSQNDWMLARSRFASILSRTPNVTLLLEGAHRFWLPSAGTYSLSGIKKIDGRVVSTRVHLGSGIHSVIAVDSATVRLVSSLRATTSAIRDVSVSDDGDRYTGVLEPGAAIIRLRMSYSQGWRLRLAGVNRIEHLPGDFFMNAWTFPPVRVPTRFVIEYRDGIRVAEMHRFAEVILALLALVSISLLVWPRGFSAVTAIKPVTDELSAAQR